MSGMCIHAWINMILTATYKVLANQKRTKPRMLRIEEDGVRTQMLRGWSGSFKGASKRCLLPCVAVVLRALLMGY
jgi:hypothetical protein